MQSFAVLAAVLYASLALPNVAGPVAPPPETAPPVEATASPAAVTAKHAVPSRAGRATPAPCDNAGFLALQADAPGGYHEVTVCGNVAQVLPERTTPEGRRKYFFVTLDAAGDSIEIVTNVEITGEFDVRAGALANVHGRYHRDNIGTQLIDWTHHTSAGDPWPFPGYVQLDGARLID